MRFERGKNEDSRRSLKNNEKLDINKIKKRHMRICLGGGGGGLHRKTSKIYYKENGLAQIYTIIASKCNINSKKYKKRSD